jgi:hypothetical protein
LTPAGQVTAPEVLKPGYTGSESVDDRLKTTEKLVNGLIRNNVTVENIFVDTLNQGLMAAITAAQAAAGGDERGRSYLNAYYRAGQFE